MTTELSLEQFFCLDDFEHSNVFEGCYYPWEALSKLQQYLTTLKLGNIETEVPLSAYLAYTSLISIGKGTIIEPGVYIQGPCVIGKSCTIRHGAYIRGNVLIGDGCVIGHDTEIKNSIFLNQATAAHFNYVGDSIIGKKVNLGAGVKCANLRLDHETVHVTIEKIRLNTNLRKLGAIVADGAQVGCNCVLNPGTLLGKNSVCFPCLNVQGFIPEGKKVKPAMKNIVE